MGVERKEEPQAGQECCETLASGYGVGVVRLFLSAQDMHKTGPQPPATEEGDVQSHVFHGGFIGTS